MSYIKGIYTRELFHNADNGYTVGVLKLKDTDIEELQAENNISFVGTFYDIRYKTNYKMEGELVKHPKYGSQFSCSSYEVVLPTKRDEIIEFLSSDLFPIGEKTAEKIVDLYKEDTINSILENPNCLLLVPKLSKKRIEKIYETLLDYQSSSGIIIDLNKLGFDTKMSLSLLNKYKSSITNIIRDNIYMLIEDNDLNFLEIDAIAKNIGIEDNDQRRLEALIIYIMNLLTFQNGDTYLNFEEILSAIQEYLSLSDSELDYVIMNLNKKGKIIIENNRYYLKKYYDAEKYIVDRLCYLNDLNSKDKKHLDEYFSELEKDNGIIYDDTQKSAIKKAINSNLTIITGGPGTGKTTIVKAIVTLLKKIYKIDDHQIALLAPTGRAAKKLMETTLLPAYTIHKYLQWDKEKDTFMVNEYNPNMEKYIIVDETSMIDTILLSSLLKGLTRDVKLILVGDYYQLPSISQGQVLKDLIDSEMLDVVKLNCLYRQNEESYIVNLAYEIKNKELSESFLMKKDDYKFIECSNEEVMGAISEVVIKAVNHGYTDKDIQILCPIYKSLNGIDNLNILLQNIFNKKSKDKNELSYGPIYYREQDKVLQLINDPDNNVFNGDIGYISFISPYTKNKSKKDEITIDYEGTLVTYTRDKFSNFRHGYAISIHKSQGNEFKMVILPMVNSYKRMLYNKLVYTAVTRAKEKLIIVGDIQAFQYGVNNDYVENRKTTLKEFIISKYIN